MKRGPLALAMMLAISLLVSVSQIAGVTGSPKADAAQVLYDDFDDGDADGWLVETGTWEIDLDGGDHVYSSPSASQSARSTTGQHSWADYAVEAQFKATSWEDDGGVAVVGRKFDEDTYYLLVYSNDTGRLNINRRLDGVNTVLTGMAVPAPSTGTYHSLRLEMNGTTLQGYLDDDLLLTVTDDAIHHGRAGIQTIRQAAFFDDVEISDFPSLASLEVFSSGYPRAIGYRSPEADAVQGMDQGLWEDKYSFYDGIIGKVLNESKVGREPAQDFFLDYKDEFTNKLTMLHFHAGAILPDFEDVDQYHSSQWTYHPGTKAVSDIPAASTGDVTTISVEDSSRLRLNIGFLNEVNEDLVLVALDGTGNPVWQQSEQVELLSRDLDNDTITVRRAQLGTVGHAYTAGHAYLAAHVYLGPLDRDGRQLWGFNYSDLCPDHPTTQKSCTDTTAELVAEYLEPGGLLEDFDGVDYDVPIGNYTQSTIRRGVDTNADLSVDDGYDANGENRLLLGQHNFASALRTMLPDKLITADGSSERLQPRNFEHFNGAVFEGWPSLSDTTLDRWSSGVNKTNFWDKRGAASPHRFNYIVHKWSGGQDVTPNINRLALSIAQYMNYYANAISITESGGAFGDPEWDELVMGAEREANWLGFPVGPTVRMAKDAPDQLGGHGVASDNTFVSMLSGAGMVFDNTSPSGAVKVSSSSGDPITFRINDVPTGATGGQPADLTMFTTLRADPIPGRPVTEGRLVTVRAIDDDNNEISRHVSWTDPSEFEASFYLRGLMTESVTYEFEFEGSEPVWLSGTTVNAGADLFYREFENGLVMSNPSDNAHVFDLATLLPGRSYHRLQGTEGQDPVYNNGSAVGDMLTVGPRDAIFLSRDGTIDDTAPPSFNGGSLGVSEVTPVDLVLNWDPASDDTSVASYEIYQDSQLLETISGALNQYRIEGLDPSTQYSFDVHAVDLAEKRTTTPVSLTTTTPAADTSPPTWTGASLTVDTVRQTSAALEWDPADDNYRIDAYQVFINGDLAATLDGNRQAYTAGGLTPGQAHTATVQAVDNSGNVSTSGPSTPFTTADDPNPPLWSPTVELRTPVVDCSAGENLCRVRLQWDRPFDESGISLYRIYQDDVLIETTEDATPNYLVTGLTSETMYEFRVEVQDVGGNWSRDTLSASVTTPPL